MFEDILAFICANAHHAHWIIFGLLLLAGINVPISEDVILLTAGAIVATCLPDSFFYLYIWIFIGCWISAWEAYAIGRFLGPKLYDIKWFSHILTRSRIERLHYYYEKYGIMTFIVGRFIPGGVRNTLFMTSGLGKMPFLTFILRDLVAVAIQSSVLYYIGFQFGEHYHELIKIFVSYQRIFLTTLLGAIILITLYFYIRKKSNTDTL
jgi:membrane protein DedA with SNARE-associated domain